MREGELPICPRCGEVIAEGDVIAPLTLDGKALHYECGFRSVVGGANHIRRLCTCCGGTEPPDPPWLKEVWRSQTFLVQVYANTNGTRLSVKRTEVLPQGRWREGLTWDELQEVKRQVGWGDHWAVELFPPGNEVVNDANMRHLWLIDPPPYGWRNKPKPTAQSSQPDQPAP